MLQKPESCKLCPFRYVGAGFCPDSPGMSPKVAMLFPLPAEDDIYEGVPLRSRGGRAWLWRLVEQPLGFKRDDILIANILRCRPANAFKGEYPTGKLAKQAEKNCRVHDEAIRKFDPNIFIVSEYPGKVLTNPPLLRQIQRHVERAFRFAEQGDRPILLMGEEALHLVAPELSGTKKWLGHWWEGKWK